MRSNAPFGLLLLISAFINEVYPLNILGVFPYQGKSHFFVFKPYLEELARRGHNLTIISHFPQNEPLQNYHDISLAGQAKILEDVFPLERSYLSVIKITFFLTGMGTENCRVLLANENVQRLWKSNTKFDLVVVEQFNSDCALGLAYKLGAPVIGLTSHTLMEWHFERFGMFYNPSYISSQFFEGGTKPSLYQRIERSLFHIYISVLYKLFDQRIDDNTLAQYFDDVPPLNDLARDIKLLLVYTNMALNGPGLLPPNVIEVGGYHVAKPKTLPHDIKKFIEESEHGVIYVSFGSMLRAISTPRHMLDAIISALSELPQRVIWKWEEPTLPGNPKDIYISHWLPQNDILAHPKVLAFYSHCGLLGTTEAMYHGVPMVGMPVFGDQPGNAAAVEESGLGVQIQVHELTKQKLLDKLTTVLDPNFRHKVKQISKAWHDRPVSPMDSAIYWTEYAARYTNITLQSPSANVPFYQVLCLDVLSVLLVSITITILLTKSIVSVFRNRKVHSKNKYE